MRPYRHLEETNGYVSTLEAFLYRYFPRIQIFHRPDSGAYEVWLPSDPGLPPVEKAVDEAWERRDQ